MRFRTSLFPHLAKTAAALVIGGRSSSFTQDESRTLVAVTTLTKTTSPLSSHDVFPSTSSPFFTLDSLAALENASAKGFTAILWLRGYKTFPTREVVLARETFITAVQSMAGMRGVIVDDASDANAASALEKALGVSADVPFICVLRDFNDSRTKYLLSSSVSDARSLKKGLNEIISGQIKPTLLGQERPLNDRSKGGGLHVIEVVTDSFDELVTNFQGRACLLYTYSRACDACAAFAPRIRILATLIAQYSRDAKGTSSRSSNTAVRIARLNIADNDVNPTQVPPRAPTPMVLLFKKSSSTPDILHFEKDENGRAHLPSVSQLAAWLFLGDKCDSDSDQIKALITAATHADIEAERIEIAFDQLGPYAAAWRTAVAMEGKEALLAANELREKLTIAYSFLVDEATLGDALKAESLVNDVATCAARHSNILGNI